MRNRRVLYDDEGKGGNAVSFFLLLCVAFFLRLWFDSLILFPFGLQ